MLDPFQQRFFPFFIMFAPFAPVKHALLFSRTVLVSLVVAVWSECPSSQHYFVLVFQSLFFLVLPRALASRRQFLLIQTRPPRALASRWRRFC
jgi:hypothetical protein